MNAADALICFLQEKKILEHVPEDLQFNDASDLPLQTLGERGCINELEAIDSIAKHLNIKYFDLQDRTLLPQLDIRSFSDTVRPNLCWEHRCIPLFQDDSSATIAFANPFDYEGTKKLEFVLSKAINIVIAEEAKIVRLLAKFFPQANSRLHLAFSEPASTDIQVLTIEPEDAEPDKVNAEAPPIVRLSNKIIADAIQLEASDIHIEPGDTKVDVRFRIDGMLQDIIQVPKRLQHPLTARLKIISGLDISERRRPQDGRLRVSANNTLVDMRVSSVPTSAGEKLVLRILRSDYEDIGFGDLGMSDSLIESLHTSLNRKGKLLLVSGPTGSGKTTTLYVCLNHLRDGRTNITTIEDPIEYRFPGLNQIQVNRAIDVTFVSVLRSVLRQDPDIIMIGEIRDSETLGSVLQAAQTGHLVLSTVHTNDAPSAITRLLTLGGDPYLIATSLAGVVAQRLVRKTCDECKAPASSESYEQFSEIFERYSIEPTHLQEGTGCSSCFYTGYRGRLGIYSYLEITEEVGEIIFSKGSKEELVEQGNKQGFEPLDQAAVRLLKEGKTTFSEIRPYLPRSDSDDEDEFQPAAKHHSEAIIDVTSDTGDESSDMGKPQVLIVDDSKDVRRMLTVLLKKEMVDVVEAENGLEALERMYEQRPDIVVCDISMPVMDGREFLERVKSNKQTRDIPIIMLTVDDTEATELELLKLGVREFLSKASSPMRIVGRIRTVLNSL